MIRYEVAAMADDIEAMEDEIHALRTMDPYDPQITALQERVQTAMRELYRHAPRGV